jgi:hypothetical protein
MVSSSSSSHQKEKEDNDDIDVLIIYFAIGKKTDKQCTLLIIFLPVLL